MEKDGKELKKWSIKRLIREIIVLRRILEESNETVADGKSLRIQFEESIKRKKEK